MDNNCEISDELKLGKLFEAFKRLDKAEAVYRSTMAKYPTDFRAYFNCARVIAKNDEKLIEAYELFKQVIELDPSIIDTYGAIAAILIKMRNPAAAMIYCEAGLCIDKDDSTCMFNINIALRQTNLIEEAVARSWKSIQDKIGNKPNSKEPPAREISSMESSMNTNLTFVCVKWGKKYGYEYVNNLYSAIMRYHSTNSLDCGVKVVCFTEDSAGVVDEVQCYPFSEDSKGWQGWWLKAQVFAPHPALTGWTLYIDLDTVICGSLGFLDGTLHTLRSLLLASPSQQPRQSQTDLTKSILILAAQHFQNEARMQGMNSSMIFWNADQPMYHTLYSFLTFHYAEVTRTIYKFDHYVEMMLYKHLLPLSPPTAQPTCEASPIHAKDSGAETATMTSILDFLPERYAGIAAGNRAEKLCFYFQDIFPDQIVDYFEHQKLYEDRDNEPISYSIVCFPLKPKPHELLGDEWIQKNWVGELNEIK